MILLISGKNIYGQVHPEADISIIGNGLGGGVVCYGPMRESVSQGVTAKGGILINIPIRSTFGIMHQITYFRSRPSILDTLGQYGLSKRIHLVENTVIGYYNLGSINLQTGIRLIKVVNGRSKISNNKITGWQVAKYVGAGWSVGERLNMYMSISDSNASFDRIVPDHKMDYFIIELGIALKIVRFPYFKQYYGMERRLEVP